MSGAAARTGDFNKKEDIEGIIKKNRVPDRKPKT